ncbi:MAG: hypothetical protein AAF611_02690 [Bacteroidota bacterium]
MKKNSFSLLLLVLSIFCVSCNSSDDTPQNAPPLEVDVPGPVDDLLLIAATNLGEVYNIGNNVAFAGNMGQIDKENSASILPMQTLIGKDDTIYAIEYLYNPTPTNNLLVYEVSTNTTQIVPLTLPSTIMGDERGIIALAWNDDSNMTAILSENVLINGATKHLVNINLQDYSITELGITFTEDTITSMLNVGTNIYVSTWNQGFLTIDTTTNSVTNTNTINGSRLAQISTTELALMQNSTTSVNGARPATINLSNSTVTPNDTTEEYGLINIFGGTILEDQTYLNLVSTSDVFLGVLKTDVTTGESELTAITSTGSVDRNVVIVTTWL